MCRVNQVKNEYMIEALKEASKAFSENEVPVGAVVVYQEKIIGRGYNKREQTNSFLSHAEIIAMEQASQFLKSWRLEDCDIYVTLEPCQMCAGAMIQSRVRKVHFGAYDLKSGATNSIIHLFEYDWNHRVEVEGGILEELATNLLKDFFIELRKR